MAVEMIFDYANAANLLLQSIKNDARPVILLDAESSDRIRLAREVFDNFENIFRISFSDFLTDYVYSIKNQASLLEFSYIAVDNVEGLRGLSKTLKILSTFIDNMTMHNISVIFLGNSVSYDLREVIHISGSKIQYIIKIEPERTNEK